MDRKLFGKAFDNSKEQVTAKGAEIRKMKKRPKRHTVVIVPTEEKNGSFVAMETIQYIKKVELHLEKLVKKIDQGKLVDIEKKYSALLNLLHCTLIMVSLIY